MSPRLLEAQAEAITTAKGNFSFDAKMRGLLLGFSDLAPDVRELIELVDKAGSSTLSKYQTMLDKHVGGRIHGTLLWNGAGQTGRFSSRGSLQLHNMKRNIPKNADELITAVVAGEEIDEPAATLGSLVRGAITHPEGITWSDFKQIEARVFPWLADSAGGEVVLQTFVDGKDPYITNALMMFQVARQEDVDAETRHAAKCASLACQFGGGKGAFLAMAEIYGLTYSEEEAADIVKRWRAANPYAIEFWEAVSGAAIAAVLNPRVEFTAGKLVYFFDGKDWLWCKLPCGRLIAYFQPRYEHSPLPWDSSAYQLTALHGSGRPKKGQSWPRRNLSFLILVENCVQAVAASVMREAIVRADAVGVPMILSVHDELVATGDCYDLIHEVLEVVPSWAEGLPLTADTKHCSRYGK